MDSWPDFDTYLRRFILLTHISPFWRIYEPNDIFLCLFNLEFAGACFRFQFQALCWF